MRAVTPSDVATFERDGFLIVNDILAPADVTAVLAASDRVSSGEYNGDRRPPAIRTDVAHWGNEQSIRWYLNARVLDREIWRIATSHELGRAAASLLRSGSVSIVEDQLLDKPPRGLPCNFHQDYGYWLFSGSTQMVSCWVALVDMTLALGPLQLIPGSHRWGHASNPRELIIGSEEGWLQAVAAARRADPLPDFVTTDVRTGGGVFFHSLTFHGSARNTASVPRRAFSMHWAGETCTVDRAKLADYSYPFLFSGIDDGGRVVNKYMPIVYPTFSDTCIAPG
jgi:phytanoyl-CoA hydroxylase